MDKQTMNEKIFEMKTQYEVSSEASNNYVSDREILITITLKEYRNLIKENAELKAKIELNKLKERLENV